MESGIFFINQKCIYIFFNGKLEIYNNESKKSVAFADNFMKYLLMKLGNDMSKLSIF